MSQPDSSESDGRADWEDALLLLADENRMRILTSLVAAGDDTGRASLSYSELKERVDVSDNGTFNYHLNKLRGRFIEKADGSYQVRYSGLLAYRALMAGAFSGSRETTTLPVDADCHWCGTGLRARYTADNALYVECPDCDSTFAAVQFPPRGFEARSREALLRAVDQRMRYQVALFARGVCHWCGATVSTTVEPADEDEDDDGRRESYVTYVCDACSAGYHATVGESLLTHPAVVSFCHDRGVDLTERPVWELAFAVTDRHTEVRSRDPLRVAVTVPVDDEALEVVVDGDLAVRSTGRVRVDGTED